MTNSNMYSRLIQSTKILISAVAASLMLNCCSGSSSQTDQKAPASDSPVITTGTSTAKELVEVVVDDATGEILGIKANQVGDYYIINPQDEVMIPIEGHSLKWVEEDLL